MVNLAMTIADFPQTVALKLSSEAHDLLVQFSGELEPRLGPGGDLAELADWAGKLAGAIMRFAGLLHIASNQPGTPEFDAPISLDTVQRAIQLGEHFSAHARRAFGEMAVDEATSDARAVLDAIRRIGRPEVSRRELHRALQSRFKAADLESPLRLLQEHGYLRLHPAEPGPSGRGRPCAPRYQIHPEVLTK